MEYEGPTSFIYKQGEWVNDRCEDNTIQVFNVNNSKSLWIWGVLKQTMITGGTWTRNWRIVIHWLWPSGTRKIWTFDGSNKSSRAQACNFTKKVTLERVFSCDFCKIYKNIFLKNNSGWHVLIKEEHYISQSKRGTTNVSSKAKGKHFLLSRSCKVLH